MNSQNPAMCSHFTRQTTRAYLPLKSAQVRSAEASTGARLAHDLSPDLSQQQAGTNFEIGSIWLNRAL